MTGEAGVTVSGQQSRRRCQAAATVDGPLWERFTAPMLTVVRILHIAVAAVWFGHKLLIPADLRQSIGGGVEQAGALIVRLRRAEQLGVITGLGTLLTGLVLVFMIGPAMVGSGIYVGLGLVLGAIALGAIVARPASVRLREAVTAGDLEAAGSEARTVSQVLVAESVLWSAALVSMLV
ncbi:MAG: hypothetical protein ACXW1Y_08580 [Acidimicrobiia bacterium]